eukprot:364905-Chlamydomonas_euryale.AAC.3
MLITVGCVPCDGFWGAVSMVYLKENFVGACTLALPGLPVECYKGALVMHISGCAWALTLSCLPFIRSKPYDDATHIVRNGFHGQWSVPLPLWQCHTGAGMIVVRTAGHKSRL